MFAQVAALTRLAAPVVLSRAGMMVLTVADVVMVGRLCAPELAFLGMALVPVTVVLPAAVALLLGTLVETAALMGAGRPAACGAVWRRGSAYALVIGLLLAFAAAFGERLLAFAGQSPPLAEGGGRVIAVLGAGLPGALVFFATAFFLEGIRRPWPALVLMVAANALNILLNRLLITGAAGLPAMGAVGAAWATTIVRTLLAAGIVLYVLVMADGDRFGIRLPAAGGWHAWARQRRIGIAAGVAIAVEASAFGVLGVFAGWLGAEPLAAFTIVLNLVAVVFMTAVGFGVATAVEVGHAWGRHDVRQAAVAGWLGLAVNTVVMGGFALVFALAADVFAGFYTADVALALMTAPLIRFAATLLVADGGQAVMAQALRGRGDTWVPTALHVVSYFGVMVPAAWALAFAAGRGVLGLFEAALLASIVALTLLVGRFLWLARSTDRAGLSPPPGKM
jgi:MATE family multidrug resistance protein